MAQEAGDDSKAQTAVAPQNQRQSSIVQGAVDAVRNAAGNSQDQPEVLSPGVLRVRAEADRMKVAQIGNV